MHIGAMTIKANHSGTDDGDRQQALLALGGLFGALAATSCCILPLILFSLGVSGAWIGNFTQLAPYHPLFVGAALVCIVAGAWLVGRASQRACGAGEACARPLSKRLIKAALVVAALLVVAAIGFDLLAPRLLNS
jgi:mercuric ion transport protein